MNQHDQRRKESVIKALQKAKERADIAHMYLTANESNREDVMNMNLALEHIEIALEHLGVSIA